MATAASPTPSAIDGLSHRHTYQYLAGLILQARRERGINRGKLAKMIGYQNLTKGARRISEFERGEHYDQELASRMASALGVPQVDFELAWLTDWSVLHRQWTSWVDEPIQQYVILATGDFRYRWIPIELHLTLLRTAEHFASRVARKFHLPTWLIFSRRIASHFDRRGHLTRRVEALPPSLGEAFVEFGGYSIAGWTRIPRDPALNRHRRFAVSNRQGEVFYSNG